MNYMITTNELYHHGILGQKWGIRRYQPYPSGHTGGKFIGEDTLFRPADRDGLSNKNRAPKYAMDGGGWTTKNKRPKNARYTIGKNKKGLVYNEKRMNRNYTKKNNESFAKNVQDELTKKSKKKVTGAAANVVLAVTTAAVASAIVLTMAKKGKLKQADLVRVLAKKGISSLRSDAVKGLVSAGIAATAALAVKGGREIGNAAVKGAKKLNKKRLQSASRAAQRDANNLRSHGYTEEANAVQKVADRNVKKSYSMQSKEQKLSNMKKEAEEIKKMGDKEAYDFAMMEINKLDREINRNRR